MLWLVFAIGAYALYAVTNYIEKFIIDKEINSPGTLTITSGLLSLIVTLLLFILTGFQAIPFSQTMLLLIIGMLAIFYYIPYFKALALDDASRIIPLYQFYPVFALLLSFLVLHQSLTVKQFMGFCFILFAGFILGSKSIEKRIFTLRPSFWYMVLSSFIFSIAAVLFKFVTVKNFWVSMSYQTLGVSLGGILLLLYAPWRNKFLTDFRIMRRRVLFALTVSQWITLLADFSTFYALTLTSVALVSVMQGTQPVFVLLYGFLLTVFLPKIIKEDIRKEIVGLKVFSIVLLLVGVVLINF